MILEIDFDVFLKEFIDCEMKLCDVLVWVEEMEFVSLFGEDEFARKFVVL